MSASTVEIVLDAFTFRWPSDASCQGAPQRGSGALAILIGSAPTAFASLSGCEACKPEVV
jgi:hypothetical protein